MGGGFPHLSNRAEKSTRMFHQQDFCAQKCSKGLTHEIDNIISLPKSIGDIFVLKLRVPEKSLRNNVSGTFLEDSLTVPLSKTELRYPVIVPCSNYECKIYSRCAVFGTECSEKCLEC